MKRDIFLCKHELFAEWCWECKHQDKVSIKIVLLNENIEIVQHLLTWRPYGG